MSDIRIVIHPMFVFQLYKGEELVKAKERTLRQCKGALVCHMPIHYLNTYPLETQLDYMRFEEDIRQVAEFNLDYPDKAEDPNWTYPGLMDELMLSGRYKRVVFAGGYVESCLALSFAYFIKMYGTYVRDANIEVALDEEACLCASRSFQGYEPSLLSNVGRDEYPVKELTWCVRAVNGHNSFADSFLVGVGRRLISNIAAAPHLT